MKVIRKVLTGLWFGFCWTFDGTGYSSKTRACIASFEPADSLTWRWALYYVRPQGVNQFSFWRSIPSNGYWETRVRVPFLGGLELVWQPRCRRREAK